MTLQKEKKNISDWWREHFIGLLNRLSTVDPAVLDQIPHKPTINSIDLLPTMEVVEKAIKQSSSNKAPGMDSIPVEIYKGMGPVTLEMFHSLLIYIWEEDDMPKISKMQQLLHSLKIRIVKLTVENSGESPSSTAGKILSHAILNFLITSSSEEYLIRGTV